MKLPLFKPVTTARPILLQASDARLDKTAAAFSYTNRPSQRFALAILSICINEKLDKTV
jgi:hypothetical protein